MFISQILIYLIIVILKIIQHVMLSIVPYLDMLLHLNTILSRYFLVITIIINRINCLYLQFLLLNGRKINLA